MSRNGRYVIYGLPGFSAPFQVARYDAMTDTVAYAPATSNDYPMAVADNGMMLIRRNLTAYWANPDTSFNEVAALDAAGGNLAILNVNLTNDGMRVIYSNTNRFFSRNMGDAVGTLVYDANPGANGVISASGDTVAGPRRAFGPDGARFAGFWVANASGSRTYDVNVNLNEEEDDLVAGRFGEIVQVERGPRENRGNSLGWVKLSP
jgi:hypothetical protein